RRPGDDRRLALRPDARPVRLPRRLAPAGARAALACAGFDERSRSGLPPLAAVLRDGFGLGAPRGRRRIGRHPPVAQWREGATRADLRGVGQAVPLELVGEEALEEDGEPAPDRGERVPALERMERHPRDAAWPEAEAQEVVEEEVVQLVGADDLLGLLRDLAAPPETEELRTDRRLEDAAEDGGNLGLVLEDLLGRPADELGDEGLRHARVDAVMRHVVAAVGREAEG